MTKQQNSFPPKGIYRHFKGGRYELLDFAHDSETTEWMVVYRALYGERELWVRPLTMWNETVERDGKTYTRFLPEEEYLRRQQQAQQVCAPLPDKRAVLKEYFGYDGFREGQEEVVDAIISGRDTLAVMPTGAGKSLCYQVPALMLPGISIIVSPLISLMKDQVQALIQSGIPAAFLNSSLTERQFRLAVNNMIAGKYKIIYVAPERLNTPRFLDAMQRINVSMLAVDEAHCISQWGQDFRPGYLEIPDFTDTLRRRPVVCAFTATATERVRNDIRKLLRLQSPYEKVTGFDRTNLYYAVEHISSGKDKAFLKCIAQYKGLSGVVYCASRKNVEAICDLLRENGFSATRYHAGLSDEERKANQDDFSYDRAEIMVATNAFGMGIDKSNVRFVIHYNMPKDPESYYQEAGRAGRDGERADCILLYSRSDIMTQKFFIDHMGEESALSEDELIEVQKKARDRLDKMVRYCETSTCLRKYMLNYFGEKSEKDNCGFCLNCLGRSPENLLDVTQKAGIVLACVEQTGERFGRGVLADVLLGSETESVRKHHLDRALTFGALRTSSKEELQAIFSALVEMDALLVDEMSSYPVLKHSLNTDAVLSGDRSVVITKPSEKAKKKTAKKEELFSGNADRDLFARLRDLRKRIAEKKGVPPYVIFPDSTLYDMAAKQPRTPHEMENVKGVGLMKMRSYGTTFLKEVQDYMTDKEKQP